MEQNVHGPTFVEALVDLDVEFLPLFPAPTL
jgi:hypothetical protein